MKSNSKHWDTIFSNTEDSKLGWYEKNASQTFELLNQIPDWKKSTIFLPGAGTSVLIDELLSAGAKLVLNDISIEALNKVKDRLSEKSEKIVWLCQDISQPVKSTLPGVDIWIDRAVLHFLTDEDDIGGYFENVKSILKTGGYAVFAEFSKTGAPKCAGLTLHRYSIEELSEKLGSSFKLIVHFEYTYTNPSGGPRPYIYALFKKESQK
ncbi:class I SAM-dependent methyltransferase [Candidatus Desantisbacteria bacterium]|nr:class I SAM-dependent methyltransferase [Candidatus Desantisbacteria bacterium]